MRLRLPLLFGALIMAVLAFTVPASATPSSPTHGLSQVSYVTHARPDQSYTFTLCLNTETTQCLNQTNCDLSEVVEVYNFSTGGACSQDWYVSDVGNVGENGFNVFWCGDDFNATYHGDVVFQVVYSPGDGGGQYVPTSTGSGDYVYVTEQMEEYLEGYWVAQASNLEDTRLIDVTTSCNADELQYVYAATKNNGGSVKETHAPASLWYWAWEEKEF